MNWLEDDNESSVLIDNEQDHAISELGYVELMYEWQKLSTVSFFI